MKILFYGASVTAQKGASGYVSRVRDFLDTEGYEIEGFGIGACHLDDAGFYNADQVINKKPDLCLLEWNTTGLGEFNKLKLQTILINFTKANIALGFMIFPRKKTNAISNRVAETQIIDICKDNNIPLLDIRDKVSLEENLRDDVHTNEFGAELYAQLISDWIIKTNFRVIHPSVNWKALPGVVNHNFECEIVKRQNLHLNFTQDNSSFYEIVFEIIVGPSIVDLIIFENANFSKKSFIDRWCYYDRTMYYTIWKSNKKIQDQISLILKADENEPNLSVIDKSFFRDFTKLRLPIKNIFSCGLFMTKIELEKEKS